MVFRWGFLFFVLFVLVSCNSAIVLKNDESKAEASQNFKEDVPFYTATLEPPKGFKAPIPRCGANITVFTGLYDDGIR